VIECVVFTIMYVIKKSLFCLETAGVDVHRYLALDMKKVWSVMLMKAGV